MTCLAFVFACGGERPTTLGVSGDRLGPCPPTSNCVSSDVVDDVHRVEAFSLARPPEAAWSAMQEALKGLPRVTVVEVDDTYLHAEFKSAVFRFVDDLELHLRSSQDLVAVRSASRIGGNDLGANRRRVERLRQLLRAHGVIR